MTVASKSCGETPRSIPDPSASISGEKLLASLDVKVPPTAIPRGYRMAVACLAIGLTLIPLLYIAILAFFAYLVIWHATETFTTLADGPFFIFHLPMAIFGALLLLFLIKPVFFRKRPPALEVISLKEKEEPRLFAYVRKLCGAIGSKTPVEIEVDCDANAHARLHRGTRSMLRGELVLRVGLPLAGGLSLRQFTGVVAHELGHFRQRHGMNGSYLIRRLTFFFAQVVFKRDKIDETMLRHRLSNNGLRKAFYWSLLGPIEAARGVLWLMLLVGELLSCTVLRRMEFDADRMEALFAGTPDFIETSRKLGYLQFASQLTRLDLVEAWEDKRLADDVPRLTVINSGYLQEARGDLLKKMEGQTTRWFDTHPSHSDRIAEVQRLNFEPLLALDAPATGLFGNFSSLSKLATGAFYNRGLSEKASEALLVPSDVFAGERVARRRENQTLRRFMRGHVVLMQPVFPGNDADQPIADVEASKASLRTARQTMLKAAENLGSEAKGIGADFANISAARAQLTLCEIFDRSPQAARVQSRATRLLKKAEPAHEKALRNYQPFAQAARERLTTALRLVQSEGWHVPRAGGGEAYTAAVRARARQLVAISRTLDSLAPTMNKLGSLAITVRVLMSAYNARQPSQKLVQRVVQSCNAVVEALRTIARKLEPIPFPFAHATEGISIRHIVVPREPADRDPVDTHECAVVALNAYSGLTVRVLAELAQLAEGVESSAELEPLPDLAEIGTADPSDRRSAGGWKYVLSYGARAVAGIIMLTVLVYFSIHPPVLPEMPWDNGAAPGGYQPNSFHVPFTPPPRPINYQLGNRGAPGSPQAPGSPARAPIRPGAPLPPGAARHSYNPFAPSRSQPGGAPNSPNRNSPSRWGGGGGGYGGGGGRPGGGGGGRR